MASMSEDQIRAFLAKIAEDPSLQEKLKLASTADEASILAKELGFALSSEDIASLSAKISGSEELGDNELENAAGGLPCLYTKNCIKATTGYRTLFAFDCGG